MSTTYPVLRLTTYGHHWDVDGISSPAFFLIAEKTGLARLPCCCWRCSLVPPCNPARYCHSLLTHWERLEENCKADSGNMPWDSSLLRTPGQCVFNYEAPSVAPFTSVPSFNVHSAKSGPPISRTSKWVVVITSHKYTQRFPLSCPLLILHNKILQRLGYVMLLLKNLQRCAVNDQITTNLGVQYYNNVGLQPFLDNVNRCSRFQREHRR